MSRRAETLLRPLGWLAVALGLGWSIALAATAGQLEARQATAQREREHLLQRDSAARQQAAANHAQFAKWVSESGGHALAANHLRILRILAVLRLEKTKMPASDPVKSSLPYISIGAGGMNYARLSNPAYAAAYRDVRRFELASDRGFLLKRFAAEGIDVERFSDLLVDNSMAQMNSQAAFLNQGMRWNDAEKAAAVGDPERTEAIRAFLGDQAYAEYQAFDVGGLYGATIAQERLSYAATPMTADQLEAFSQIAKKGEDPARLAVGASNRTIDRAKAILTPEQFAAFQDMQQTDH